MLREIVFDIETQNTFMDVGQGRHQDLKVSMVCLYDTLEDKYYSFKEDELNNLWPILEKCDRLIGYNSKYFDVPVLNNYYAGDLSKLPHLDILEEIKKTLGFRLKLDDVAKATLGTQKSGNGLQAVEWYKQGEIEKIREYCLQDVKVTRDIYEFGKKNKQLFYTELASGALRPFPINFEVPVTQADTKSSINLTLPF